MTTLDNLLDQALDIAGTLFQTDDLIRTEESQQLGRGILGQNGSMGAVNGTTPDMIITGLTGMTSESIGHFLTISGADSANNNGTFLITQYNDGYTVHIYNELGVTGDTNNDSLSWIERFSWSAEDDHNFHRTDRSAIKGAAYDSAIPTYNKIISTTTNTPANLTNIAGKTTDAKAFITDRKYENLLVNENDGYAIITAVGLLKHAGSIDITGIPVYDGADAGNDDNCYVEIIANGYEKGLVVLSGPYAGNRIFGRTRVGSSISPDSIEIEWRSVVIDDPISSSVAYTWEAEQASVVDIYYPYRSALDTMEENAFRKMLVHGLVSDAGLSKEVSDTRTVIGINIDETDLSAHLTNTGSYYPFYNLPDATPSVIEALNTLNAQIGSRDYIGTILTDGVTIVSSIQQLANAIENGTGNFLITRVIERITSNIHAGTEHILPGGLSYQTDLENNGSYMYIFWRKQLRDPGHIVDGDDYEETSTTSITPYTKIQNGDHINYFITSNS
jgi:hypothetical protein